MELCSSLKALFPFPRPEPRDRSALITHPLPIFLVSIQCFPWRRASKRVWISLKSAALKGAIHPHRPHT